MLYRLLLSVVVMLTLTGAVGDADAQIYGLKKGMSLEDVRALGFGELEKNKNTSISPLGIDPPKFWLIPNLPNVWRVNDLQKTEANSAVFVIHPETGLLQVTFYFLILTDNSGKSVQKKFKDLLGVLTKQYGMGEIRDFLHPDSIWDSPDTWMIGLFKRDRTLQWHQTKGDALKNFNLEAVALEVIGQTSERAAITLTYRFEGMAAYLAEIAD